MTDEPQDLEEVQRRLDEIQRRKREGIRWQMSRHTAEREIVAFEAAAPDEQRSPPPGKGKQRRRKRRKRLL
jgi:anti-sigma factor RsiW